MAKMNRPISEEKIKPFRLVKYFTFAGLVVIFLVTLILTILNTHWVKAMQRQKSEDYAHALIENLNHQVFLQFIYQRDPRWDVQSDNLLIGNMIQILDQGPQTVSVSCDEDPFPFFHGRSNGVVPVREETLNRVL